MCGIAGMVAKSQVAPALYDALTVLQHRGQDAAGIVTAHRGRLTLKKNTGLVRDVFRGRDMHRLRGTMGIAHCRYPTAGSCGAGEAQPFYVNSPYGITLAHNGNLTNSRRLSLDLFQSDMRHINTESDSEVLLNVFAHELQKLGKLNPTEHDIFDAVAAVHRRCRGAYACVAMIAGYGIVGFRDPHGIRPLIFGIRESRQGLEYAIVSESVALDALDFEPVRDVAPGEAIYITADGQLFTRQCVPDNPVDHSPCLFEYVYLARPDSILDQISIYKSRLRMGEKLAEKVRRTWPDHDLDVVIPIPDSGRTAALQLANTLNVKYREGFIKNRYIGRTFIMPGQSARQRSVRQKLNAIGLEFLGKHVMLVDDSIVRGTTCKQIIQLARDAGARKVSYASAAPPVRYPNVYGIDMPSADELIAHNRTEEEVARLIGADRLIYQDLPDLIDSCREGNPSVRRFDASVFDGQYVTGDIDDDYLSMLHNARNDQAKSQRQVADAEPAEDMLIDL